MSLPRESISHFGANDTTSPFNVPDVKPSPWTQELMAIKPVIPAHPVEHTLPPKAKPDTASTNLPELKLQTSGYDETKGPSFAQSLFSTGAEAVEIVGATAIAAAAGFTLLDASVPVVVAVGGAVAVGIAAKALGNYMFDGGDLNKFSRDISRDADAALDIIRHGAHNE